MRERVAGGRQICIGTGQRAVYKHADVWPYCPVCDRNLGVQGKHQRVIEGVIGRHFVPLQERTWFTAEGWEMKSGQWVWTRKLQWAATRGTAIKERYGVYSGFEGRPMELKIRVARNDYRCEDCGERIARGDDHAGDFYTHYCLNCVTSKKPESEFREVA